MPYIHRMYMALANPTYTGIVFDSGVCIAPQCGLELYLTVNAFAMTLGP